MIIIEKTNYTVATESLIKALNKKYTDEIVSVTFKETMLQGGTVADVRLLEGTALSESKEYTYKLVLKVQDKWERFGDEDSWRREYDLYASELHTQFTPSFRWPDCYLAEFKGNTHRLWMEYIESTPGKDFTVDMYVTAARALGEFQGKLFSNNHKDLKDIPNLSNLSLIKDTFYRYSKWDEANSFIRDENCALPKHIQSMLINLIDNGDAIWQEIEQLPVVFSQRDYWFTNLFYEDGNIVCIDWDTTGWGYLSEDLPSLIVDEVPPKMIVQLYNKCVPAYFEGFCKYVPNYKPVNLVNKYSLVYFGLRIMADYMYSKTDEAKQFNLDTLEAMYQINK